MPDGIGPLTEKFAGVGNPWKWPMGPGCAAAFAGRRILSLSLDAISIKAPLATFIFPDIYSKNVKFSTKNLTRNFTLKITTRLCTETIIEKERVIIKGEKSRDQHLQIVRLRESSYGSWDQRIWGTNKTLCTVQLSICKAQLNVCGSNPLLYEKFMLQPLVIWNIHTTVFMLLKYFQYIPPLNELNYPDRIKGWQLVVIVHSIGRSGSFQRGNNGTQLPIRKIEEWSNPRWNPPLSIVLCKWRRASSVAKLSQTKDNFLSWLSIIK